MALRFQTLDSSEFEDGQVAGWDAERGKFVGASAVTGDGTGDMVRSVYDTDNDGKVNEAELADAVPWSGVTGAPSEFPPEDHTHAIGDVTGLQDALEAAAEVSWGEITDVPTAFPPSAHNHPIEEITGLQGALDAKVPASGLTEQVQDIVGAFFVAGSGISLSYNDASNTFTITNSAPLTAEDVQDIVGAMVAAGSNVTAAYNDAAGTLTISAAGGAAGLTTEDVQDIVGALLTAGTNVTLNYNDASNTLTVTAAGGSGEANTASNLGTTADGAPLFSAKAGVDLQFKRLKAGANITLNQTANSVEIVAASGGGSSSSDERDAWLFA